MINNETHNEQHIRWLLKKYVEDAPLSYWFMTKIKYKANKEQKENLNIIYGNVKHILVKERASDRRKEAFLTIFINFYRLYKMSISYGKGHLNNALIVSCNNNVYVGKNTVIPKVVRVLRNNGYINKVHGGYSYKFNHITSWYTITEKMHELIQMYVEMGHGKREINVIDLSRGDCNIRLKKKDNKGHKYQEKPENFRWNKQLRKWDDELEEINERLAICDIGIANLDAFKKIYLDKNYEIFLKQYEIEKKYWLKAIGKYREKNPDCIQSDAEICDNKIEKDMKRKRKKPLIKWKTINMVRETLDGRYERIANMRNIYMQLPNFNTKRLYRAFIEDSPKDESFSKGGRHFHIWVQNVPEQCQKYILIDNEPTLNIDICSCHFLLLAARHNDNTISKEKKYYDIGIKSLTMVSSRKNTFVGRIHDSKVIKKKIKKIVNTLLNAKDEESFIKSGKDNGHIESDLLLIKDKIIKNHTYLKEHHYLCSGEGVKLQKEESDFIHKVMYECFIKNNINVICMCDGLIVKQSEANIVEDIMYKVWKEMGYKVDLLLERKVG